LKSVITGELLAACLVALEMFTKDQDQGQGQGQDEEEEKEDEDDDNQKINELSKSQIIV
jgi:hypothetical protein